MALQVQKALDPFQNVTNALRVTLFTSVATVAGCILSRILISKFDRKTYQTLWFSLTAVCLLALGFGKFNPLFTTPLVIITMFLLYNFFVALVGATTYLIPAEIYETSVRATGHGFVSSMGKVGAFIGTLFLPFLEHGVGIFARVSIMAIPLILGAILTRMYPRGIAHMNLN